jgi:acyl carrier protein
VSGDVDGGYALALQDLFRRVLSIEVSSADTDLIERGLLDSLALVELLVAIEREFGIEVNVADLEIETFRSIATISDFIVLCASPQRTGSTG